MPPAYARWIDRWERRLAGRDTNRIIRPFEWGLEWVGLDADGADPARVLACASARWLANSEEFYSYAPVSDYRFENRRLTFTSPIPTPHPENDTVHADYFPASGGRTRAVVVLPQWNAGEQGHAGLCKLLNRFGITALRMSLAYHDRRMPAGLSRADYHVSSNIGRTIQACRQSVVDTRACLDWLQAQGHTRLGIVGTSLGSCIGFIATAHDTRVRLSVYNHASMYFGDVVWTGLATEHVRRGVEGAVTQEQLRECWKVISPAAFLDRMTGRDLRSLIVWAGYDTSFLPCYSRQIIQGFRSRGLALRTRMLPCGHYTTGEFPFKFLDGLAICRFVQRNL